MIDASAGEAALGTLVLAATHLFAGRLRFLEGIPRRALLSAFSGVSVAYVCVHLLPEIAEGQEDISEASTGLVASIERHAYLVALLGIATFYGLELLSRASRRSSGEEATDRQTFVISMLGFTLYNGVVGYLLHEQAAHSSAPRVVLFASALALHFVVNDFALREHHRGRYHRTGRWVLAAAVVAGWTAGAAGDLPSPAIAVTQAFIGGGVLLNVLKEELPEERQSRFSAFLAGAAAYAVVLLAV